MRVAFNNFVKDSAITFNGIFHSFFTNKIVLTFMRHKN
jgi:hypothetical protein